METLREQAEKMVDLYGLLNDTFPDCPKRENLILVIMAGLKDAQNSGASSVKTPKDQP